MKKQRKVLFCSIGFGGNSNEYGGGCHRSWYLFTPEEIARHYADELEEGVFLVDKRPALEVSTSYAYASPLVNAEMKDGDVDRFIDRYQPDNIMIGAMKESAYGTIIEAAEIASKECPDLPGPLDYVPIGYFVQWWQSRGALVYRYDGTQFVPQGNQS